MLNDFLRFIEVKFTQYKKSYPERFLPDLLYADQQIKSLKKLLEQPFLVKWERCYIKLWKDREGNEVTDWIKITMAAGRGEQIRQYYEEQSWVARAVTEEEYVKAILQGIEEKI